MNGQQVNGAAVDAANYNAVFDDANANLKLGTVINRFNNITCRFCGGRGHGKQECRTRTNLKRAAVKDKVNFELGTLKYCADEPTVQEVAEARRIRDAKFAAKCARGRKW